MATTLCNSAVGYLYWMLAARLFRPEEVGRAASLIAAMSLGALVANLGLGTALIDRLSAASEQRRRSATLAAAWQCGTLSAIAGGATLAVLVPWLVPELRSVLTLPMRLALAGGLVVSVWANLIDSVYIGDRRSVGFLARGTSFTLTKLLSLPLVAAFVQDGTSAIFTGWVVCLGCSLVLVRRVVPWPAHADAEGIDRADVRSGLLRRGAWHHVANLGGQLPMLVLPVVVIARVGADASAFFYITWMIGSMFFMASNAIANALFAEGAAEPASLARQLRRASRVIAQILIAAMMFSVLFGETLLGLFGPGYRTSGYPLLLVLVLSAVPDAVTNVWVSRWRVLGRTGHVALVNIMMAAVAIGFAYLMTPTLGIVGAGWAWVLAQSTGCIYIALAELWSRRGTTATAGRVAGVFVICLTILPMLVIADVGLAVAQSDDSASETDQENDEVPLTATDESADAGDLVYQRVGFDEAKTADSIDAIDQFRLDPLWNPAVVRVDDGLWLVPFDATEIGRSLRLAGEVNESVVSIPVPPGFELVSMRASLTLSPDVDTGYVEFFGPGSSPLAIEFGHRADRDAVTEVELDLSEVDVESDRARVTFRNRLRSEDPVCTTNLLGAYVDLSHGVLLLRGDPAVPTTVANFFPPLLERVEISLPRETSPAEAEAAARMAIAASRSAIGGAPTLDISALWNDAEVRDVDLEASGRAVAISEDLPAGVHLVTTRSGGVVLALGGDGAELIRSAEALMSSYSPLVVGTSVSIEVFDLDPEPEADAVPDVLAFDDDVTSGERTSDLGGSDVGNGPLLSTESKSRHSFRALELGRMRLTGVGRMDLPFSISQSALGGPVSSMRIHVEGVYTPIDGGAQGSMSFNLGGQMIQGWTLGDQGAFKFDFEIPEEMHSRSFDYQLSVDYSPEGGCDTLGAIPMNVQINPDLSFMEVGGGQSLEPGFARFPQTLLGGFAVGLATYDLNHVAMSVRLLAALQRLSPVDLSPEFVDVATAMSAPTSAVVISSTTASVLEAGPMLSTDSMTVIDEERLKLLDFEVDLPHAVLEAYESAGADRLLLTWSNGGGPPRSGYAHVTELLDSFSTRQLSFQRLFGDTYLLSDGSPPVSLSLRGKQVQRVIAVGGESIFARLLPLQITAVAGMISVVIVLWMRSRRKTRAARQELRRRERLRGPAS